MIKDLLMDLTNYFCIFSWENGKDKRHFKLCADGTIEDLFGSKGNDNERFWQQNDEQTISLLSSAQKVTSIFKLQKNSDEDYSIWLGDVQGKAIKLKLICVRKQSDLFEAKTKLRHREQIKKGLLEVGNNTYGTVNLIDGQYGKVVIGDYCSIAGGVYFVIGNHRIDLATTYPFATLKKFYSLDIDMPDHYSNGVTVVGNDVWIGQNVMIMSGVQIGDGAIIASNAVVTKNVEPYSIVGGNPAKHIKYRIENPEHRQKMQEIAWWNWSEDKIMENIEDIMSPNISQFIKKFYHSNN